ncbi:MAG: fimbrial protein, partial [Alistipes sp.]|nr:fimbrial protein [Alistipes sp.]
MRHIIKVILCLTFPAMAHQACVNDPSLDDPREQELPVTISLAAPATRAVVEGDNVDYEIDRFRIMGFRAGDGSLAFNEPVNFTTVTGSGSAAERKATVNVLTGTFTVVFIANEQLDAALSAQLASMAPDAASIDDLKALSFSVGSLGWKSGNTNLVPMAEVCQRVIISGDDKVTYDGVAINGTEWPVTITRLAVRVDLTLKLNDKQLAGFEYIRFDNVPDRIHIFPETESGATVVNDLQFQAVAANTGYTTAPGNITSITGDYAAEVTYPRILLPEVWFSPKNDKDRAVVLTACIDSEEYPAPIGYKRPQDYTLPRNVYYDVKATVAEGNADVNIEIEAEDWDDKIGDGLLGHLTLNVSAIEASINERNMARIYFWTDQSEVYIEELDGSGQPVDELFYGLNGGSPGIYPCATAPGEGWFDYVPARNAPR